MKSIILSLLLFTSIGLAQDSTKAKLNIQNEKDIQLLEQYINDLKKRRSEIDEKLAVAKMGYDKALQLRGVYGDINKQKKIK